MSHKEKRKNTGTPRRRILLIGVIVSIAIIIIGGILLGLVQPERTVVDRHPGAEFLHVDEPDVDLALAAVRFVVPVPSETDVATGLEGGEDAAQRPVQIGPGEGERPAGELLGRLGRAPQSDDDASLRN